ncbi:uncharacterized protein [Panulirus ornatus]|uniref:uncharacterized protein n=1 Tax=Panulirus ornatus TaxID=150431 RepID=UPI003A8647F0
MLDRVLRCFEAMHVFKSRDALLTNWQGRRASGDTDDGDKLDVERLSRQYWQCHPGVDNWRHDLFFHDFSLEEEQFPESEAGSVSSAADQHRFRRPASPPAATPSASPPPSDALPSGSSSCDPFTARCVEPSSTTSPPPLQEEEAIITPPEEFRGTPEPQGSGQEDPECLPPPDVITTNTGEFRLMTETEYWRSVQGGATPGASVEEEEDLGCGEGQEAPGATTPECSLTNLEHPSRAAYLRSLLTVHQPPPPALLNQSTSSSPLLNQSTSSSHELPSATDQSTSLSDQFTSASHRSTTHSPSAALPSEEGHATTPPPHSNMSVGDAEGVHAETEASPESDAGVTATQSNIEIEDKVLRKIETHRTEVSVQLSYSHLRQEGEPTSDPSSQTGDDDARGDGAGKCVVRSEGVSESDNNSGSTGTPPPVDFSTHPLSPKAHNADRPVVSMTPTCDETNTMAGEEECSSPFVGQPRFLSTDGQDRFLLHQMYPDCDSESGEDSPSSRESVELSLDSEEVELFINNPESMVVSRVNMGAPSEAQTPQILSAEWGTLGVQGGDGGDRSPSSARTTPEGGGGGGGGEEEEEVVGGDGWGVGAGPAVSDDLLSLEGEEFVEILGALVGSPLHHDDPPAMTTPPHHDDPPAMTTPPHHDDPSSSVNDPPVVVDDALEDTPPLKDDPADDPASPKCQEGDDPTRDDPDPTTTGQPAGVVPTRRPPHDHTASVWRCWMYAGASGSSSSSGASTPLDERDNTTEEDLDLAANTTLRMEDEPRPPLEADDEDMVDACMTEEGGGEGGGGGFKVREFGPLAGVSGCGCGGWGCGCEGVEGCEGSGSVGVVVSGSGSGTEESHTCHYPPSEKYRVSQPMKKTSSSTTSSSSNSPLPPPLSSLLVLDPPRREVTGGRAA